MLAKRFFLAKSQRETLGFEKLEETARCQKTQRRDFLVFSVHLRAQNNWSSAGFEPTCAQQKISITT